MRRDRRRFLRAVGASGVGVAFANLGSAAEFSNPGQDARRFRYIQIDVFTSQRLQGNPLIVFPDARGLADEEMAALARETNLQETTFVFPREPATEREHGVKVRIYIPGAEVPFGGHPTLGTAMVLRNLRTSGASVAARNADFAEVVLDLKVGKVRVEFRKDDTGNIFGEMHQVDPIFGPVHERETIASLLDLQAYDIATDGPIQTMSTGLPFVIVPIKTLGTVERLKVAPPKAYEYLRQQKFPVEDFYYVTRDTGSPAIGLRSRAIFPDTGEDAATGSAAGCTAAWMVRHGVAEPEQTVHILQGVEMKRPSHIFARASKDGDAIRNVRVGGHAVPLMEGTLSL